MGGLAAVMAYGGSPPARELAAILAAMLSRGGNQYGVSDGEEVTYLERTPKPEDIPYRTKALMGYTGKSDIPIDLKQPVKGVGFTAAGDGEVYLPHLIERVSNTVLNMRGRPLSSLERLLEDFDGSFSILLNSGERICAARDLLGVKPLYYGSAPGFQALASERKALWVVGIRHPLSFPPGCIGEFSRNTSIRRVSSIYNGTPLKVGMDEGSSLIESALRDAVKERLLETERVAVAFSGGLDSSLIALAADKLGLRVELYAAMVEDAPELEGAYESADLLGLKLRIEVKPADSVLKDLNSVLWLVEEPDRMRFEVALPLYWAASKAYKDGFRVMLSGQGSDELFAGYSKFLGTLARRDWTGLDTALKEAVAASHSVNFERDEPILTGVGLAGRFPYADRELVRLGLKLSPALKVSGAEDGLRKRILREAALRIGLPKPLVFKAKKSTQYGSGVHKALTQLARGMDTTPRTLLHQAYEMLLIKVRGGDFDGADGILPAVEN